MIQRSIPARSTRCACGIRATVTFNLPGWARARTARGIGWTYAAAAAHSVIAGVLAGVVIGRGALDVPGSAEALARAVRNIGRLGIAATAISAVDIALWDLKARLLGSSLAAARLVRPCYPRQFGHRCGNVGSPPVLERLLEW